MGPHFEGTNIPRQNFKPLTGDSERTKMAANNILKIKTTRFPDYIYNLDPERYKKDKNKILKIEKAQKKKKSKKRNA